MRAFILLCDFAEEIGGKLYIMGGGWSRLTRVGPPLDFAVAGKVLVPWVESNRRHDLELVLLTQDGSVVHQGDNPVLLQGHMEVGRPPGLPEGSELDLPVVFRLQDLDLGGGRYRWELKVDGNPVADATFDVSDRRS